MSSSLVSQLANIGSLDAARLSAATAKSRPSFLFSPRQAASLSNADVHGLGYNGFLSLLSEDRRLERYETPLFGEKAKNTDRALLTKEENAKVDRVIAGLLRAIAGKFLVKNTGKVIEWLIRRFRVNEFNVEDVLALILPFHETPQFAQMLQIMNLEDAKFTALQPVKKSLQPLPRQFLLTAMVKSHNLFLWTANLLKPYIVENALHPALVSFWTASLVGYIDRSSLINENQMLVLLPVLVEGLKTASSTDVRMGACLILSRMAPKVEFSNEAMDVLINALLSRRAATAVDYAGEGEDNFEATVTTLVILCESQRSALDQLPKKALSSLLRTSGMLDAVVALSSTHSALKLLQPLFASLIEAAAADDRASTALVSILSPASCPDQITAVALPLLIDAASAAEDASPVVLQALSVISQRDSDSYYASCDDAQKGKSQEEKSAVRKVMAAVSGYGLFNGAAASGITGGSADADLALSLASNDAQTRAQALSKLLEAASSTSNARDTIPAPLMSIILERLADPATAVASVLLDAERTPLLVRLAKQHSEKVLSASLSVVNDVEASRASILFHLEFLTKVYLSTLPDKRMKVLEQAIWPKLLATKANAKLWKGVWTLLKENSSAFPLLAICAQTVNIDAEKEDLPAVNEQVASKIAESIQASDVGVTNFLLESVRASDSSEATSSILAALVLAKLVTTSGDAQLITAVLAATEGASSLAQVTATLPSPATVTAIFAKPASSKTQTSALAELRYTALLSITAPRDGTWSWLSPAAHLSSEVQIFRTLALEAYQLAHTAGTVPAAATAILTALFSRAIKDDALAFFMSVYSSAHLPLSLRLIAMKDALAFLEANEQAVAVKSGHNDLQAVLPGLLVALSASEKEVRLAAFPILEHVARMAKKAPSDLRIYGFDSMYGSASASLQYLQVEHVQKLTRVLLESKTEVLLDGSGALRVLLSTKLDEPGVSKKKSLSHAVLCYIASHAIAWHNTLARTALLASVRGITDSSKAELCTPLLASAQEEGTVPQVVLDEYAILLAEAFGTLPKAGLSEDILAAFLNALQSRNTDRLGAAIRKQARERIRLNIFAAVSPAQRLLVLEILVTLLLSPVPSEASAVRSLVNALDIDGQTFVAYLAQIGQSFSSSASADNRSASGKKSRSASSSGGQLDVDGSRAPRLVELGALLENIDDKRIEVSMPLLSALLEMLGALVELQVSNQVEVAYHAQLLMATMTSVTARLAEQPTGSAPEGVRISPVMETIRISNNTATSNQALTLIAELVKLVPEQVVQNILPIFTFMGTNVLQRDDAYSARVVDRTIESIIPALVRDRSKRALTREHLLSEMSDFMRVFADAANHVPRHRRNRLFIRFAEVLGSQTFLAPLCSLLVDKVALRYVKSADISLLALPLAVISHFPASMQLTASHQLLGDLVTKIQLLNTEASDGSLASRQSTPTTPAESPALPINASRRTVLASLVFLSHVVSGKSLASQVDKSRVKESEDLDVTIQDLMKTATSFYTIAPQKLTTNDLSQLLEHVQTFILAAGKLLTVPAFSEVAEWAIKDEDTRVFQVAYDLLLTRLKSVKSIARSGLTPSVLLAMDRLRGLLETPKGRFDKTRSLYALRNLSMMAIEDEIASVSLSLSAVLALAESEASKLLLGQALAFICENIPRLGARIIPSVSRIVTLAIKLLRQSVTSLSDKGNMGIAISSLLALAALFQTVPTFVAAQLQNILQLCVQPALREAAAADKAGRLALALNSLTTAATRKVPPKSLFTNVTTLWERSDRTSRLQVSGVLDILVRSLRAVSATTFGDVYKQAFALLVSIFDTRRSAALPAEDVQTIENTAISAYMQMVLKLNEGTFRPLFLRLFDWAVVDLVNDLDGAMHRKITLFRIVDRMLSQLKTIAVPYYSYMLDQVVEILGGNAQQEVQLVDAVMSSLRRAFEHDTIGFWTASRLAKLVRPIAARGQAIETPDTGSMDSYSTVLIAFAQVLEAHETILHELIKTYLEQTRSDSEKAQLAALRALQTLWDAGIDASLAAHSAESMPYLVETLEAGGQVARATKDLLARMNEDAGEDSEGDSEDDDESVADDDDEEELD